MDLKGQFKIFKWGLLEMLWNIIILPVLDCSLNNLCWEEKKSLTKLTSWYLIFYLKN